MSFRRGPHFRLDKNLTRLSVLALVTAASRAYLLDIWFNPQVDQQAIDRIHRIGQKEDVVVTRITIRDTIEDSIARLQDRKSRLARGALGDDSGAGGAAHRLTLRDLIELFGGTNLG